jgi:hypothetical protein
MNQEREATAQSGSRLRAWKYGDAYLSGGSAALCGFSFYPACHWPTLDQNGTTVAWREADLFAGERGAV